MLLTVSCLLGLLLRLVRLNDNGLITISLLTPLIANILLIVEVISFLIPFISVLLSKLKEASNRVPSLANPVPLLGNPINVGLAILWALSILSLVLLLLSANKLFFI